MLRNTHWDYFTWDNQGAYISFAFKVRCLQVVLFVPFRKRRNHSKGYLFSRVCVCVIIYFIFFFFKQPFYDENNQLHNLSMLVCNI